LPGFFTEMDRTGPWTPVPLRVALAQPGGPVEQRFFQDYLSEIETALKTAGPLDAVFISAHGAALAEGTDDPDGDLFEVVRRCVGPDIPVVAVFDLHANVSQKMIDNLSVFVGYLANPHTDIYERGVEAAKHMRECLAGQRTAIAMVKVPLVPPQISLLTQGALCRPDQLRPAQARRRHPQRVGDGRLRLQRQSQERADGGGDRAQRQQAGGIQAGAQDRQTRLGYAGTLQAGDDVVGRRRAACRLGRPRP